MTAIDRRAMTALMLGGLGACATRPPVGYPVAPGGEPHRPRFHFTPETGWMNDPNGLVWHAGEYHLFYQFYPDDTVWGPMHWGHAVSRDLVTWDHLPIALAPDERGYIFSGSVVVDHNNSAGFGRDGVTPLVAVFTYHDPERARRETRDHESQALAYSLDHGRSWTKWAGNPALPNPGNTQDFRDPNVIWHAPSRRWIMALSAGDHAEFWGSRDLTSWSKLSEFGRGVGGHDGVWECPDLFQIMVEETGERRWVLIQNLNPGGPAGGSGTQYFVGDFDGRRFTLDPEFADRVEREGAVWLDHGHDNYAGVTWHDVPERDGRRLFIGWMSNWLYGQKVPTQRWRSAMTVPRELRLHREADGLALRTRPAVELQALRVGSPVRCRPTVFEGRHDLGRGEAASCGELTMMLDGMTPGVAFGLELSNGRGERYRFGLDTATGRYVSDRSRAGPGGFAPEWPGSPATAPRRLEGGPVTLTVLIDVASIEIFADDGRTVMTEIFFPSQPFDTMAVWSEGGEARLISADLRRLRSIRGD